MTNPKPRKCHVCSSLVEKYSLAEQCIACSNYFCLNPYNSQEFRDCGDAIIGPSMGVEYWCEPCLEKLNATEEEILANSPPPIFGQISQESNYLPKDNQMKDKDIVENSPPPLKKIAKKHRRYRRI